jgi:hypothetical protein
MSTNNIRILSIILLFAAASMACQMLRQLNEGRQTAQAVITEVRGLATEGRELLSTAQTFATENPEAVQTARSFTTTQGPALLSTAKAFVTDNPGAVETGRALLTEIPGFFGTEASRTDIIAGSTSSIHPDIPVLPGSQRYDYYESEPAIFYVALFQPEETANFYRSEMPVYDWLLDPDSSFDTQSAIVLAFRKPGQQAQVIIAQMPGEEKSVVTINLTDQ